MFTVWRLKAEARVVNVSAVEYHRRMLERSEARLEEQRRMAEQTAQLLDGQRRDLERVFAEVEARQAAKRDAEVRAASPKTPQPSDEPRWEARHPLPELRPHAESETGGGIRCRSSVEEAEASGGDSSPKAARSRFQWLVRPWGLSRGLSRGPRVGPARRAAAAAP